MASLFIPKDGRITSQNFLTGPLTGDEVQEIVSPGTEEGDTYQTSLLILGKYFSAFPSINTLIVTSGPVFNFGYGNERVLINKIIESPTSVVMPPSLGFSYNQPLLIKDLKGDAFTNNIIITFSGIELCDGQSQIVIDNDYGWTWLNPIPGTSGYFQT